MAASSTQKQQAPEVPAPSRMGLANVKTGVIAAPLKEVVYGPDGVGKTTFGAEAPKPIFLSLKDGARAHDVARFPTPKEWPDVLEAIRVLIREPHEYQTLVIDDVDWFEPLVFDDVTKNVRVEAGNGSREVAANIESYGYGKGYEFAVERWLHLAHALDVLQAKKQMHVIVLAHAQVVEVKNPSGANYDSWALKLNKKAAAVFREWAESVLFCNLDIVAEKESKKKWARAKGTARGRFLFSRLTATYHAKTRHAIPERLPLDFAGFYAAVRNGTPVEKIIVSIERGLKQLADAGAPDDAAKARAWLKAAGTDPAKVARVDTWISSQLKLRAEEAEGDEDELAPAAPASPASAPPDPEDDPITGGEDPRPRDRVVGADDDE